jgi:tRNA modification GTPase
MKLRTNDTIAAIATPPGAGAISIVRMSGPDAISLADKVFRGNHRLSETPGYTIRHGRVVDAMNVEIDEVLASVFRSPHSYTGEDGVEISCHGGSFITKRVLSVLIEAGARQADPGEFTKRAFLNGRIDLSQAEAVADLINANSERALRNSNAQMNGVFGSKVRLIRDELLSICSLLELTLDFSEDDVSIATQESLGNAMWSCVQKAESAIATYRIGKVIRDGASVAIVGRPNVGKSSLFNALLMINRSIVSRVPGTTRDFLEESIAINGTMIRLFDTAGIRKSFDDIEADGIARTRSIIESSDVVVLVVDSTQVDTTEEDLRELPVGKVLITKNKADLTGRQKPSSTKELVISAKTGEGLNELREAISKAVHQSPASEGSDYFVSSNRHLDAIVKCRDMIARSIASLRSGLTAEFISMDLRVAVDALSEITGEVTTEDIINGVFSRFCIGK